MPFDQYRWRQSSVVIDPGSLASIGATPFGWVAVGAQFNFPTANATIPPSSNPLLDLTSGEIWTSTDGLAWVQIADAPEFHGARMTNVIGTETGALIFGIGGFCLPDACSGLPPNGGTIVWSSSDGQQWTQLADTGLGDGAVTAVTRADEGFVAVGYVADDGSKADTDPFNGPTDAAIWSSTDGAHWASIPHIPVADRLSNVSASGSRVIAIGSSDTSTVAWTSLDGGSTWTQGPTITDDCCSSNAIRDGLAVVVADTNGDQIDGFVNTLDTTASTWVRTSPTEMRDYSPDSIRVIGSSFVVFGWTVHRDSDGSPSGSEAVAFSSSDGVAWTRAALPDDWDGQAVDSIANHNGKLVAIVSPMFKFGSPPKSDAQTIWVGTTGN